MIFKKLKKHIHKRIKEYKSKSIIIIIHSDTAILIPIIFIWIIVLRMLQLFSFNRKTCLEASNFNSFQSWKAILNRIHDINSLLSMKFNVKWMIKVWCTSNFFDENISKSKLNFYLIYKIAMHFKVLLLVTTF